MSEKKKIYFVSDVHLGAQALKNNHERELLFVKWLDEIKNDVTELYLLGDIFDFWFEYKKVVPRGFIRVLGKIAEIADRGIPVHFFTGNHDLWVFDYLPKELGVILHTQELITEISGKKFFLAHGDGFDPEDKGYNLLKKIFTNKKLQWLFSRLHPNFAFYLAHEWSKSSRLSKIKIEEKFKVKNEGMYKFAESFLKKEQIDYFIFGHRHQMVDVEINRDTKFILLGDWISNFSYGVFDGEKFELKRVKDFAES
ncbi:MAG: UDP-2,3-diacylglucosamine diphosphatase [Prolixibacteraceae bacterium]|mgnify:CR=1 FL=1|nr:UDP-2,3-diacylglucosamine diphosphatase [Prolixibacteraceae bacterium]MBT6005080.1 UDP-2,3-diacylglucosamine diphosphatase [Prolixibacteraceae bacterium]MBT6766614.1 UDP-2,3-diacylglucosamine diphosphatase [Prolixibacteraceae bacterium]MBT6999347.1 UDP-2,3-diacylglucosamine diphosphatase [Prolixibacteraceae bacterium]MBT7395430.1 UDP-2,3-diacylglucosamine diphosphatase [Prolixibacteraceae bacterium]